MQIDIYEARPHLTGLTHFKQGISETAEITPEYCSNMHTVFDEFNRFEEVGGWPKLNEGLGLPMVLVMSIWNDVSLPPSMILCVQDLQ